MLDLADTQAKRKRSDEAGARIALAKKAKTKANGDYQTEIILMEGRILDSRKHYNDIASLLTYLDDTSNREKDVSRSMTAAVALCRIFCRLMAVGSLSKTEESSANDQLIIKWLLERLEDYKKVLLMWLTKSNQTKQTTALTLSLRLFREESNYLDSMRQDPWSKGIYPDVLESLITGSTIVSARTEFVEKYANKYDDIRYHTFSHLADKISGEPTGDQVQNMLSILEKIQALDEEAGGFPACYLNQPLKKNHLNSHLAHKKQAQRVWLGLLRQPLDKAQRKRILESMSTQIAPWFLKVELLMDFLTDSFDIGGSTSLMALSGLFYLIQQKNLDYPQFYQKLYSLLDKDILHSKHRSRFFRLLDTFLNSTHLPAALVASFIKRLSRLSIHAPPSGIVVLVPWIYNLLKNHPTCTFMIHRADTLVEKDEEGWGDPFRADEPDPMETDAIESSLWEIEALQSHYHPNVATLAKIISEQFTKHSYNVEDFLDHSYATMLDAELCKDIKKPPEIEYEIPKKIFTKYEKDSGKADSMLVKLWDFP